MRRWLEQGNVSNFGYVSQTYCSSGKRAGFSKEREWAVVESDLLSLEQKLTILRELGREWPLKAVCWSGGRSLHG